MKRQKNFYKKLYEKHLDGLTIKELSNKYDIKYTTLYYGFKRNGFNIKVNQSRDRQKYNVNRKYFDKIDTEDKAYFLGLLMSDGCITKGSKKTPRLLLKLHKDDKYIIEIFRDLIIPNKPLQIDKNSMRLEISDPDLVESLIDKGFKYNKTKFGEVFPIMHKNLQRHFIRGFFDGDGSISKPRKNRNLQVQVNICCSNRDFLLKTQSVLKNYHIETILTEEQRETKNMFRLIFSTHNSRCKLYKFMYNNICENYKLNRKFIKFKKYVNTVLTTKSKKFVAA